MSKIMPPVTRPWDKAISRRHQPRAAAYHKFRDCLRWEFGFTCAFCLLHESDLSASGAEGWGTFQVEHFDPQSSHSEKVDDYSNLFLICKLCNRARSNYPRLGADGGRLLNSCEVAWGTHFKALDNKLVPVGDDPDAIYTCKTYDLNDPRKVKSRRLRRLVIEECLAFIQDAQGDHERLLDRAEDRGDPRSVELAKRLHRMGRLVREELLRFQAIPLDSENPCFCDVTGAYALPKVLEDQTFPMPDM